MNNDFLASGIKISTDSAGFMTVTHDEQGLLIDCAYYETRKQCRMSAMTILKEMKENVAGESYEQYERRLEREANAWRYI
jgi:hypothetical protein|tara:strand:- start:294 stop:533 length:240 start_codon:yes stop_codon:yes gene_type:complete